MKNNLKILSFDRLEIGANLENAPFLNDTIEIFIGTGNDNIEELFFLHILSPSALDSQIKETNNSKLLKCSLIIEKYDANIVKRHVENILEKCNLQNDEDKALQKLTHYLEHETEGWRRDFNQ